MAGAVPAEATKKSHPIERQTFKAVLLGLGYGKGVESLGIDVYEANRDEQGDPILTLEEAQLKAEDIYDWHQETFSDGSRSPSDIRINELGEGLSTVTIEGEVYRQVVRCEESYTSAAGPVRVMRSLYRGGGEGERTVCPLELRACRAASGVHRPSTILHDVLVQLALEAFHIPARARVDGYIRTLDGWTYFVDDAVRETQLLNFPMQANGAAMMRRATIRCWESGKVDLVCTLHDALYINCREDEREEAIRLLTDCMDGACRDILGNRVKIRVEFKVYESDRGYWDGRGVAMFDEIQELLGENPR